MTYPNPKFTAQDIINFLNERYYKAHPSA